VGTVKVTSRLVFPDSSGSSYQKDFRASRPVDGKGVNLQVAVFSNGQRKPRNAAMQEEDSNK
jgi:hypothetical protein